MLRYADYIDSASNLYEVPRPPRRGSHRPEAPAFATRPWANDSPPSLNSARSPHPLLFQSSVTPLTSDFSLLGKRPMLMMTTSPSSSKETARFVDMNRNSASTRGALADRSSSEPEPSTRGHVLPQVRGRSANQSPAYGRNYLCQVTNNTSNKIKPEFLPHRHSFDGADARESIRGATAASSVLVDLVGQMNARKGGRFSPTILESYAKTIPLSASCQTVQKRCMYPDCTKISVSRGLCRGHGGGRRCHFLGCAKSAQSRSNFCWAHGGGQRCDVSNCMRSRKTKRFCVAHIQFENLAACEQAKQPRAKNPGASSPAPKRLYEHASGGSGGRPRDPQQQDPLPSCKQQQAPAMQRHYLPSLNQALSSASCSPPNLPDSFGVNDNACTRAD